ncbi:hypothetical protein [Acaryochloris marina]|uniref:hypothetical protein n=1 Tax=Acaryochloris marina TaxID=155978 RepID=UPI001BAF89C8|nr:hypothetical protein [Acaryochloris marina]QUY45530.1 hypothetical protein I1H34_27635 [Acaryochloris marina S15]
MCNRVGPVDIEKTEREVFASWGIYPQQKSGSMWSRGRDGFGEKTLGGNAPLPNHQGSVDGFVLQGLGD